MSLEQRGDLPEAQTGPEPPSLWKQLRKEVSETFSPIRDLVDAATKPLPHGTGDGSYPKESESEVLARIKGRLADIPDLSITDLSTLLQAARKNSTGDMWDDRHYLMESLIETAADFPDGSPTGKQVTNTFLTILYNDLQHPPQSYLGAQYKYRDAEGRFNSLKHPNLGAANTPYARTVQPTTIQAGSLPDPGVLFDSVMARKEQKKHPNEISSVLFYIATIIIHDLFRTDHENYSNSKTSSYLDLAPLYGSSKDEVASMRTFKGGKLKPDCFSETRLLMFPPGVGVLLIMFNRFHNYVVEQLALINEGGRFQPNNDPRPGHKRTPESCDEDLFQTGRLVTCGLYINIILIDYVRTILNLNQTNSNWALDPRADIKGVPVGEGNQVSAEFNLVYRWHTAISDKDEKWTEDLMKSIFNGRNGEDVPWTEFVSTAGEIYQKTHNMDPVDRKFAGLTRDPHNGNKFSDEALVKIFVESVDDCANAFGPQGVPKCMRAVEILGIMQARSWNLATLNEFRKYFHLKPYDTFEEITDNKEVSEALKHLYDTPDRVELYPGLVVEDAKVPRVPSAGLVPSYTVSRAVLSDAVALVRGDRFYTTDYHPKLLTNWGFSEVKSDTSIDNGCVFYKLVLRAFPNTFEPNSIYAHYPCTVSSKMKETLRTLGREDQYSWKNPLASKEPQIVLTYEAAKKVLADQATFKVTWGDAMEYLMGKPVRNFMLAGDGPKNADSRKMMDKAFYNVDKWDQEVRKYYEDKTRELLKNPDKAYKLAGVNQTDIIRDIGNMAHVHFTSELFSLPLKTEKNPWGLVTEQQMYLIMCAVFICVFFDLDSANSFPLRQKARLATHKLGEMVKMRVDYVDGFFDEIVNWLWPKDSPLKGYGDHLIQRLLDTGMSKEDLVWGQIMGTAGGMVPNQGQIFAQTIEWFLKPENKKHLDAVYELAHRQEDQDAAFEQLEKYFLEGSRLGGETGVFRYVDQDCEIQDGKRTLKLKKGDKLMVNLRAASLDGAAFPEPYEVNLDRPVDSYIHLGSGPHQCLGWRMTRVAMTSMLKVVGGLKNLRPAPGPQGRVKKVLKRFGPEDELPDDVHFHIYMTELHDRYWPFPCSLKVNWDGDVE